MTKSEQNLKIAGFLCRLRDELIDQSVGACWNLERILYRGNVCWRGRKCLDVVFKIGACDDHLSIVQHLTIENVLHDNSYILDESACSVEDAIYNAILRKHSST